MAFPIPLAAPVITAFFLFCKINMVPSCKFVVILLLQASNHSSASPGVASLFNFITFINFLAGCCWSGDQQRKLSRRPTTAETFRRPTTATSSTFPVQNLSISIHFSSGFAGGNACWYCYIKVSHSCTFALAASAQAAASNEIFIYFHDHEQPVAGWVYSIFNTAAGNAMHNFRQIFLWW